MKRYRIVHRTRYSYSGLVELGLHRLVLRPREGHAITVIKHDLSLSPRAELFWMNDVFGNHVALAEMNGKSDHLEIINDITIERISRASDEAPTGFTRRSQMTLPVAYPQMELPVVQGYIQTVYPDEAAKINEWAHSIIGGGNGVTVISAIERLNAAIYEQIKYRRREEAGTQSPAKTLMLGTGSCRDMATLMMEACRSMGVAARFVSGYLHSSASRAGVGATHAWMEAYFPDCGWCGFDPTIGEIVSHKHISLGVSSHPRGVMPVSGIFTGERRQYLGMKVAISIQEVQMEPALTAHTGPADHPDRP